MNGAAVEKAGTIATRPKQVTDDETDRQDEDTGQMLKRLRGETSLRAVQRLTGISNAYLSQIEKEFSVFQSTEKSTVLMGSRFGYGWG